jgi:alkanesulfonate monooxygenase SsuD/methylene tetrahydromethanopterin reductase-like flavin-dependent oxidoreductase (luciferase family)
MRQITSGGQSVVFIEKHASLAVELAFNVYLMSQARSFEPDLPSLQRSRRTLRKPFLSGLLDWSFAAERFQKAALNRRNGGSTSPATKFRRRYKKEDDALSGTPAARQPYGPASVSLGVHAISSHSATRQVDAVIAQALLAESVGFDGATLSEHHAGVPGYLPQPLLISSWILAESRRIWSGPTPTLLTMRNAFLLAEEIAWTAARYPDRVGASFAAGYTPSDFEAVGLDADGLAGRFSHGLTTLLTALGGGGLMAEDPAIRDARNAPIPLLSAAHSMSAARQAAHADLGLLLIGMGHVTERTKKIIAAYEEAGGRRSKIWIRRVFLGKLPDGATRELQSSYGAWDASRGGSLEEFVHGSADQVAETLIGDVAMLGAGAALNLRVHVPGVSAAGLSEQIERIGSELLPPLRAAMSG